MPASRDAIMRKKGIHAQHKIIEFYGSDIGAIEYREASRAVGEEDLDPGGVLPHLKSVDIGDNYKKMDFLNREAPLLDGGSKIGA